MNIYCRGDGHIFHIDPERIYQGSAGVNTIRFIGCFPSTAQVLVSYKLPNGLLTSPKILTFVSKLEEVSAPDNGGKYSVWETVLGAVPRLDIDGKVLQDGNGNIVYDLDYTITENYGTAEMQFFIYPASYSVAIDDIIYNVGEGSLATAKMFFTIEKGDPALIPPIEELTSNDAKILLAEILNMVSSSNQNIDVVETELNEKIDRKQDKLGFAGYYDKTVSPVVTLAYHNTALARKQDNLTFDGMYSPTANPVATVQTVANKLAEIIGNAPESLNTLEEIAAWIAAHPEDIAEFNALIAQNRQSIEDLQKRQSELIVKNLQQDGRFVDIEEDIVRLQYEDDVLKTNIEQNDESLSELRQEFDNYVSGGGFGVDDETVKAIVEEETSPKFEEIESDITVIKRDLTNKQATVSFDGDYNAKTNKAATVATVSREIAKLVADAPEAFNTLEEIAKWIAEHPESVAQLNALIAQNAEAIAQLQETAVTKTNVEETVDSALEEAKASGEFDGYTPVKGVDYFTEADKAEIAAQAAAKVDLSDYAKTSDISSHNTSTSAHADIREKISQLSSEIVDLPNNELLVQNVAQKVPYVKVAESPTFVDSVDEMTDISKMYVLKSDGMFYSYKAHTTVTPGGTTPNFTNLVPTSIDTDGSIYNGVGYKEDVRLSSSGGISSTAQVGSVTTGFIPYTPGAFIRIKGAEIIGARDKYNGFYYINFYDANKALKLHIPDFSLENYPAVTTPSYDESTGAEVIDTSRCIGNDSSSARDMRASSYFRITAYGKGADLIVTVNEEITYTTVEGGTNTTYSWESTGISYNQPADYEERVVIAEADIDRLENKSAELTNRVNELEESGGAGNGGNDYESCYNVQMNRLYADSILKENTVLTKALETVCSIRDGSTQSRQVIDLKKNGKQKLILHLHKRENDGYDTVNDVYLPNARNDFSDVRIITDTGKVLKYQTVYYGNIDVISDSRLGNSEVSFLSDDSGYLYIARNGGVYKSTDAGKTWSKISSITQSVVYVSFVCGDGTLFFGTSAGLMFKSAPPYTTSRQVFDMSENGLYTANNIRPFQFVRLPTGEMLLGSYQKESAPRIWKSTDNGETWTKVYEVIGGTYQHVHRMYVDTHQTPVAIYAGLDRGSGDREIDEETGSYYHVSGTVLRSTDGGVTWTDLYADQKGKPQAVDHGVTYADNGYRLLGGETGIVGGHSIVRTTDDINFTAVLSTDHAVYGPEKLNGHIFAGGCGSGGGTSATLYISDDEGITWKQIYSEEANADNTLASAGIKTFLKGVFAGTDYEQLIAHNNCSFAYRPSKRIFADANSWYAEIIVDVPNGTNSITVESGYMCPNLTVINNDAENVGDAVFVMDFNENGKYIKEKVSGEIYKGDHVFTNGGKHLGYIYPDVKSATDTNAIKINSPIFESGIIKKLNLDASGAGLTISFWLCNNVNGSFELISDGNSVLSFDGMHFRCDTRHVGTALTTEGGRFVKADLMIDGVNNIIKSFKNGICVYSTTDQTKLDLVLSLLTGEKEYRLLKRSSDDITAIQHFEIRHGVPTDEDVYNSYFSGLTDNY